MSFIVYFFVAMIAAASVLFGLDSVPAPMSPMPLSQYELRAAVPPPATVARIEPQPEIKPQAEPVAAAAAAAKPPAAIAARPAPGPVAPTALDQQPASIAAAEPGSAAVSVARASPPACNVEACTAAYRSFTAADCTFQPSDGPRRLCSKGAPPAAPVTAAPITPATATTASAPATEARALACNVAACSQSYPRSFNAADCTFKPAEGPRKTCTK